MRLWPAALLFAALAAQGQARPQATPEQAATMRIADYLAQGAAPWAPGAFDASALQPDFVVAADGSGTVTFTSIFPACYSGRWPHIHYEVYPTLADATTASNRLATSQLALTKEASAAVYASAGYPNSTQNLGQVSLATDMVFSDGAELETPTITGSVAEGYAIAMSAAITV